MVKEAVNMTHHHKGKSSESLIDKNIILKATNAPEILNQIFLRFIILYIDLNLL